MTSILSFDRRNINEFWICFKPSLAIHPSKPQRLNTHPLTKQGARILKAFVHLFIKYVLNAYYEAGT